MKALEIQFEISSNTCYRKHSEFELWAHFQNGSVQMELKVYQENGKIKIYENMISDTFQGKLRLEGRQIFQFICQDNEYQVYPMKGGITVQIIEKTAATNNSKNYISFKLWEKKFGPSHNNIMLIHLLSEKNEGSHPQQIHNEDQEWVAEPIYHQTKSYNFEATLDMKSKLIKTKLIVKDGSNGKKKQFQTIFEEKKLGKDFIQIFENLQNLFEHLRKPENYQVLQKKGTIRIVNEPKNANQLSMLRKKARNRRVYELTNKNAKVAQFDHDKLQEKLQKKIFNDLQGFKKDLDEKTQKKLKQLQKNLSVLTKQNSPKGLDDEQLKKRDKLLKKEIQDKYLQEIKKLKSYFQASIGQAKANLEYEIKQGSKNIKAIAEESIREKLQSSKSESKLQLIDNFDDQVQGQNKKSKSMSKSRPKDKSKDGSFTLSKLDWNAIEVDTASSQFLKFNIELGNVVIYNGTWEWTQLFTRTIIPHGKISSLKFKITHSAYNAIAIGISDRENISEKSSLSLKNSIAYWGDKQLWEGQKIRDQGIGFKTGETVMMRVDLIDGKIQWLVENQIRAHHSSPILRDRSLHLMGYLEMYDRGDSVELLSYKVSDN